MQLLKSFVILCFTFSIIGCQFNSRAKYDTQKPIYNKNLYHIIEQLDGVEIRRLRSREGFFVGFELWIEQPIDHNNPSGETFQQNIILWHLDEEQPTVLLTEGYGLSDNGEHSLYTIANGESLSRRLSDANAIHSVTKQMLSYLKKTAVGEELASIVKGNLVAVEHRFFGKSKNEGEIPWRFLTAKQAAADHHRIVTVLKNIYRGAWLSAGYSKGGQAALIHRYFYPNDVKATIAFDAPMIMGLEDKRVDDFIRKQMTQTDECPKDLIRFQRELLLRREEMTEAIKQFAIKNNVTFSIGVENVLEYAALEYTFSFFQRGQKCEQIPAAGASTDTMIAHIQDGGGLDFYSDGVIEYLAPFYYQGQTELGYYGFITDDLKDLLQSAKSPTNRLFAPKVPMTFNTQFIPGVVEWLHSNGNEIVYVYGDRDTWFGAAVEPGVKTNAFSLVKKGGNHGTRVHTLAKEQRLKLYNALEDWLNIKVNKDR